MLAAFLEFGTKSDMYKKVTDCPGSNDEALPPTDLPKLIDEYLELRSTRDPQALLPKFSNLITWNELSEEQKADIDVIFFLFSNVFVHQLRIINVFYSFGKLYSHIFPWKTSLET